MKTARPDRFRLRLLALYAADLESESTPGELLAALDAASLAIRDAARRLADGGQDVSAEWKAFRAARSYLPQPSPLGSNLEEKA